MKLRHLIPALLIGALPLATASTSHAQIEFSVNFAPPPLPVYVQPACPVEGYLWTPGYWNYASDDYYWVPGVWVAPPRPGFLWTPGYWGYQGGVYGFNRGYWGPTVGFYGGVNYGYGYGGRGFYGGRWDGGNFRYNTAVVNVNKTVIHNTYIDKTVINKAGVGATAARTSFNGPGGVQAKPRPEEIAAGKAEHVPPTAEQTSHREEAAKNPEAFAKANHGQPATKAQERIGAANNPAAEPKPAEQAANKPAQPEAANGQNPQETKAQRKAANREAAEGQNPQETKAQRKAANREAAEPRPEAQRPSAPAGNPGRPGPVANEEKRQRPHPEGQPGGGRPSPQPKREAQPKGQPGGEKKEGHDKKGEGQQ